MISMLLALAVLVWPGAALAQQGLTDGQVAGVIKAANDAEIDAAQTALSKAQSDDVKSFAQEMMADHAKANQQIQPFVTPLDATTGEAQRFADQAGQQKSVLAGMTGAAFDSQYAVYRIEDHRDLLRVLDQALSGAGRNPSFQPILQQLRSTEAAHLTKADQLTTKLRAR